MRVALPFFAIELPDGFTPQREHDPFSAFSIAWQTEITVAVRMIAAGASVDDALAELDRANRAAMQKLAPGTRFLPATLPSSRRRPHIGTLAVGGFALFSGSFHVAREAAVGANRHIVTLCVHVHPGGLGPADPEAFLEFCDRLAATLEIVPEAAAVERAQAASDGVDPRRLYPYLVPAARLGGIPAEDATPIGHGLYLLLAEDHDGAVRVLSMADCARLGMPEHPLEHALPNLAGAAARQEFQIGGLTARNGQRIARIGPHWMAASCLFLPGLRELLTGPLGCAELLACAPDRDMLYIFPEGDAASRAAMRAEIQAVEGAGRKPLSFGFFRLARGMPVPYDEPSA